MEPIEELLRSSGQHGPRVQVPDDADVQTRLLGFIGRDPLRRWRWTAPGLELLRPELAGHVAHVSNGGITQQRQLQDETRDDGQQQTRRARRIRRFG